MKYKIMMTCAGVGLSHQKIKLIKESKIHKDIFLLAVDVKKDEIAKKISDAFEIVPFASNKNYISEVKKIIKKYNINLVIPCSDEEALLLSKKRSLIENSKTHILVDDYKKLKIFSSKYKTYKKLEKYDEKLIPEYYLCKNFKELDCGVNNILKNNKFFVVKPASASRGGKNVCIIEKTIKNYKKYFNQGREVHASILIFNKEIKKKYKYLFPLIVMEKLFQPTYDLDILANNGKLIQHVSRHRINPMMPNDGHIVFSNKFFKDLAKKISNYLYLTGIYDCDLMTDKNGQLKLLEINPRQSGSIAISMRAGINIYDQIFSLMRKKKIKIFDKIKKIKIVPTVSLIKI
jgi:carbamoylphosphate synthase large subunit